MSSHQQLLQTLIAAGRIIEAQGLGDLTRGHISVRVPGEPDRFFMKPHSVGFDEMSPENIVTCSLDGEKIGGGGRRHSEVYIHSEIYKVRSDVNCVVHIHPTYAVAFSATGQQLLPLSQASVSFHDGLPYYEETIELIRSPDKGAAVARALGVCKAVLLRNHGAAVVGRSIEEATMLSIQLENACQIQLAAVAGGGVGSLFSQDLVDRLHRTVIVSEHYAINFAYLKRKLDRAMAA